MARTCIPDQNAHDPFEGIETHSSPPKLRTQQRAAYQNAHDPFEGIETGNHEL